MYGSKLDEQGQEIKAKGMMPLITGERVTGCKFISFEMGKNAVTGESTPGRYEIQFEQSNGRIFTQSFFESDQPWAQVNLNKAMLHICSSFVTVADYYAVVEGSENFSDFMNRIQTKIMPKAAGKSFTLKITYNQQKSSGKWFAGFPNYPNYIELDGTVPSTLSTNPKYDKYSIPTESQDLDSSELVEEETSF